MKYIPMASLVQAARIGPAQALADETHQSWPIPVLVEGRMMAHFLFAPCRLEPGKGQLLTTANYLAQMDAVSGDFLELRRIRPAELGQSDAPGAILGFYAMPEGLDRTTYPAVEAATFQMIDVLLPQFAAASASLDPSSARLATELRSRYWALTAAPLHPYYRVVGRRFFTWLDSVAR